MKPCRLLALFTGHAFAAYANLELKAPSSSQSITSNGLGKSQLGGNTSLEVIPDNAKSASRDSDPKSVVRRGITSTPLIVFRVDDKSPQDVADQGGFAPRQSNLHDSDFSIYEHAHAARSNGRSPYVSTSIRQQGAEIFAPPRKPTYLYEIHATPNFIDTFSTLGGARTTAGGMPYLLHKSEREFLALGGIKWDQVVSYTYLPKGSDTLRKERHPVPNKDYNPQYGNLRAGGPQYQLAGFPEGHEAWTVEPWSRYNNADIQENGLKFADDNGKIVGLSRDKPLEIYGKHRVGKSAFYVPSPREKSEPPPKNLPSWLCRRRGGDCAGGHIEPEQKPLATSEQIQAAEKAKRVSEREFAELSAKHKLEVPWEWRAKGVKSLSDIRTNLLKYKSLEPLSPRLRPGNGGASTKVAGEVGSVVWIGSVVYSFATNSTGLDRAAAITAILPFVGCVMNLPAAIEDGLHSAIITADTVLCSIGDALILGGAYPFGIAVHFFRSIIHLFTPPPKPPTKEELHQARDSLWKQFIHKHVFKYIYSHSYTDPRQDFAFKLNNSLAITAFGVASEAAHTISALNASSEILETDLGSNIDSNLELDPVKLETGSREAITMIRESLSVEILRQQRKVILEIPAALHNGAALSLIEAGQNFSMEFITHLTSQENLEAYSQSKWENFLKAAADFTSEGNQAWVSSIPGDSFEQARTYLAQVGEYLKTKPLPMPSIIDNAFVIGQSKGLAHVDQDLLSGRDYIKQEVKIRGVDLPDTYINALAIRHAIDVIKVLQGRLKEEDMTNVFPVNNTQAHQDLQILLAMKCGRLYEEEKLKKAERERLSNPYILGEAPEALINPVIPLVPTDPEGYLVGQMLGLDNLLDSEYEAFANGSYEEEFKKIQGLLEQVPGHMENATTSSTFEPTASKDAASSPLAEAQ